MPAELSRARNAGCDEQFATHLAPIPNRNFITKGELIMPDYTAMFRSDSHYGDLAIEADNAHDALSKAQKLLDSGAVYCEIVLETDDSPPVNQIEISDDINRCPLALWESD